MESRLPDVTVIVPAHQAGAYVHAALESVLGQTYRDLEVLVVDDGSTDETAAVVRSFGPNVRYIWQANQGPSAARNAGIRESAGAILAFLDADDLWMPEFIERAAALLKARPDVGAVYAWAQFIDRDGRRLPDDLRSRLDGLTLRRLLLGGGPVTFSMLAVRRGVFETVGLFDVSLRQAEDWDIILRMVAAGIRFACIPRLLVHRRVHPDSVTADAGGALRWERLALEKALTTLPLPPDCQEIRPAALFRILLRAAMSYWRKGDRRLAVERLVEGFVEWPAALARPQTYLGVIYRLQPPGFKSEAVVLRDLERLADEATEVLHGVFGMAGLPPIIRDRERRAWSALHAVLGLLYLRRRSARRAATHAARSLWHHPIPLLRGAVLTATRAAIRGAGERPAPARSED